MSSAVGGGRPEELKGPRQWLVWAEEHRGDRSTKVPYSPLQALEGVRRRADSTDPTTWTSYLEAVKVYTEMDFNGIGFVLSPEDPYCAIDLDDVVDPDTGEVAGWAMDIVRQLSSYTELSPSGRGLHVIARGKLPPGRRGWGEGHGLYDRGRYFTMTGRRLAGTPTTIEERQKEIEALHCQLFSPHHSSNRTVQRSGPGHSGLTDAEILARAMRAGNGERFALLWAGDWEAAGYSSQSEAELALCSMLAFWTGPDEWRIANLVSRSGLYRDKWDRRDYRERTIARALEGAEVWTPPKTAARRSSSRALVNRYAIMSCR